jgi:carbamoyl-phosphate synthase large subunit
LRKVTVLVSAAGSTHGVNVINALRSQRQYDVRIVGIDSDVYAAGLYLADQYEIVPKVSEPSFKDRISQICKKYNINVVIPTHSVEIPFYSSNRKYLKEIGVGVLVAPLKSLEICDDKMKLANFFGELDVNYPKGYEPSSISSIPEAHFPLFIKPRFGSGSSNTHKVNNPDELSFYIRQVPSPIIQEYIEGAEYTVNVVSDDKGRVIDALPIKRLKVRIGLSVVAEPELNFGLIQETKKIVQALGLVGPSNVQVILKDKNPIFIEVNPRLAAGSLPLAVAAGLNIPLIILQITLGDPVSRPCLDYGKTLIRYWSSIIVDQTQLKKDRSAS